MSVRVDDVYDEPPAVVSVLLSHAIEEAGWRLVHVSPAADVLVWQVEDCDRATSTLQATITAYGDGARVRVTSCGDGQKSADILDFPPR